MFLKVTPRFNMRFNLRQALKLLLQRVTIRNKHALAVLYKALKGLGETHTYTIYKSHLSLMAILKSENIKVVLKPEAERQAAR